MDPVYFVSLFCVTVLCITALEQNVTSLPGVERNRSAITGIVCPESLSFYFVFVLTVFLRSSCSERRDREFSPQRRCQ